MKLKKTYLVLLLGLFLISACKNKEEELDIDVKRNNIIGEWNMRRTTQEIRADTIYQEFETPVDVCFTFNANGKGSKIISGTEVNFEWLFQYDPQRVVTASEYVNSQGLRNTLIYSVVTNQENLQVWTYTVVDSSGVADAFKHTLTFRKK